MREHPGTGTAGMELTTSMTSPVPNQDHAITLPVNPPRCDILVRIRSRPFAYAALYWIYMLKNAIARVLLRRGEKPNKKK